MTRTRRPVHNREEIETYIASRPAVELNIALSIVKRLVVVGPLMIAVFGALKGWEGVVGASIGAAMVAAYYLFTGWILSMTARISLATYYAGALFGFFVRLVLIGVTMAVLTSQFDLDRIALGVTVAVTYVVLLMWEAAAMGRASSARARNSTGRPMGDKSGV